MKQETIVNKFFMGAFNFIGAIIVVVGSVFIAFVLMCKTWKMRVK